MGMRLFTACYGIAVLMLAMLVLKGWADNNPVDAMCINQLLPCLNYLNGNRDPPDSCCDPLKSVIKSNPECLCSMISIKGTKAAEQAGINVTQAQELPGRCGQLVDPIACLMNAAVSNSATTFSFSYPLVTIIILSMILVSGCHRV